MFVFVIPVVNIQTGYKANVRITADSAAEAAQIFTEWSQIETDGAWIIDAARKWSIE